MKKAILLILAALLVIGALVAYIGYNKIYAPNTRIESDAIFHIESDQTPQVVVQNLKKSGLLADTSFVDLIAKQMKYTASTPKVGRYEISPGMSTYDIINKLRLGKQSPISLTIQGERTIEELAGFLGHNLEKDSMHFLQAIKEDPHESICHYLPNTYEFYWNTTGTAFRERMKRESAKYWQDKNTTILGLEMTPCEIITLASIVEKESAYNPEKPTIAGVYINRLNRGIPLQADPTVIFSMGDFSIRRVLNKYLTKDSPYNTYLYPGLPPGPICMPSMASIEAVLRAEKHSYIYFCAKPDNSGRHAFASSLSQHNRNARAFQRWLNQRGIKK